MTTELEKQFFDTFGIEPKEEKYCYWECKKPELENVACNNTECEHYRHKIHYPQITDSHTLELLAILMKKTTCHLTGHDLTSRKKIKNTILQKHIDIQKNKLFDLANCFQDEVKKKVQAIFKGER